MDSVKIYKLAESMTDAEYEKKYSKLTEKQKLSVQSLIRLGDTPKLALATTLLNKDNDSENSDTWNLYKYAKGSTVGVSTAIVKEDYSGKNYKLKKGTKVFVVQRGKGGSQSFVKLNMADGQEYPIGDTYLKYAKGSTIGKEKVWQVVYYGEKHLKQRGSSKGSYKTWVVANSREEAIEKVKIDDDEFAELKSAKPTTLDVERHKYAKGSTVKGYNGAIPSDFHEGDREMMKSFSKKGKYQVKGWEDKKHFIDGNAVNFMRFNNLEEAEYWAEALLNENTFEWYATEVYDTEDGETMFHSEQYGNGGNMEGWGGTSESSQDGMLIGGTNAELTSNQYGKGGGVKRTKTAEEIYEEEQQNAMFNSEYAKGGVIPYALRKRVENVKKKFGIDITKEMSLQAYHWHKDGMGGSGVGWEIFGQKFSIREVSRFNKRDSQTLGDTAIVLGEYYSKYGNGGMTSGWCYSIGGL